MFYDTGHVVLSVLSCPEGEKRAGFFLAFMCVSMLHPLVGATSWSVIMAFLGHTHLFLDEGH